jgi:hypothetical protein
MTAADRPRVRPGRRFPLGATPAPGDDITLGPQSIVVLRSQVRPATRDGSAT